MQTQPQLLYVFPLRAVMSVSWYFERRELCLPAAREHFMNRPVVPSEDLLQSARLLVPMLAICCGFATCLANELGVHPGIRTVYAFVYLVGLLISLAVLAYVCWRSDHRSSVLLLPALLIPLCIVLLYNHDLSRMLLWLYYVIWCMWLVRNSMRRDCPLK